MPLRPVIVGEKTSVITLTQGYSTIVSNDRLPLVENFNWCVKFSMSKPYAVRRSTVAEGGIRKKIRMHRVLLQCPEGLDGDHIDGNSLNNTNENLRIATRLQNNMNVCHRKNNTTGVHGVYFDKRRGKYHARIRYNGKNIHLGRFASIEDARSARLAAKKRYHGNYGET